MTKFLVWWQAYKHYIASGRSMEHASQCADNAVLDYIAAKKKYGKELA